jgi:hypothetical protein
MEFIYLCMEVVVEHSKLKKDRSVGQFLVNKNHIILISKKSM